MKQRNGRPEKNGRPDITTTDFILVATLTSRHALEEARRIHEAHVAKDALLRALRMSPARHSEDLVLVRALERLEWLIEAA